MRRLVAVLFVSFALCGCGNPATAKALCASLDVQISSDSGIPATMLDSFQRRLNLLLFDVAKIKSGNACHLNVAVTSVAPGVLKEEPDPLHFNLPRHGAGRAVIAAELKRDGKSLWSSATEMVFGIDTQSVKTSALLRTFFDTVTFDGAIDPFSVANADTIHANLCGLSDSRLVPARLDNRVRILRYIDISTGAGMPCAECWSLLSSGGVDKILFDPLGPEAKEFEAAFGTTYRLRYLSALQSHLNIANPLTGEPVALRMIGLDGDRVPILQAEPSAGIRPDAVISFDHLGLNLGTNIGHGTGNGGANIETTNLEVMGDRGAVYVRRDVTYGSGLKLGDCAVANDKRKPDSIVMRFVYLNKLKEN